MKLEQNKPRENKKLEDSSSSSNNKCVPKELRKLIFNMEFKDGEPRISGRSLLLLINDGEITIMECKGSKQWKKKGIIQKSS